jgi:hypothetical protein
LAAPILIIMSDTNYPNAAPLRPTFLTLLCVLSFIAGAWGLFSGVQSSFTDKPQRDLEEARSEMEEAMDQMGEASGMVANMMESAMALAEKSAENAVTLGYVAIVTSLLSLLGVWFMWNLRRLGFGIYVVASLLGLLVPFAFLGFDLMTFIGLGVGGFITVLFIILYAVNLKHMR